MSRTHAAFASALLAAAITSQSQATLITFTGGTVVRLDSTIETTNNSALWDNVNYYQEGGFRIDFLPNTATGFSTHVGDYYRAGNDVIHSHWATGVFGFVTAVRITKLVPGTFDFNYFTLTSNTEFGGGQASTFEEAWVQGYNGGFPVGSPVLLPSEDWGFPATQIALPSTFDAVDMVEFYVTNHVDCFGMDDFYIDQVPAPGAVTLGCVGALLGMRRRRS